MLAIVESKTLPRLMAAFGSQEVADTLLTVPVTGAAMLEMVPRMAISFCAEAPGVCVNAGLRDAAAG
jgi:hypothetical protein